MPREAPGAIAGFATGWQQILGKKEFNPRASLLEELTESRLPHTGKLRRPHSGGRARWDPEHLLPHSTAGLWLSLGFFWFANINSCAKTFQRLPPLSPSWVGTFWLYLAVQSGPNSVLLSLFHVRGWETQTFEGSCSVRACTFLSRGNAGWEFLSGLLAAVWPCVTALPSCCRRVPPSEQGLGCLLWTRGYKHKAAVLGVFVFFRWPPLLNLKNTQAVQ